MKEYKLKVERKNANERVDKFLAKKYDQFSRSYIQKIIKQKQLKINNETVDKSYQLAEGDLINFYEKKEKHQIKAVNLDLDIIYEDSDIVVINKEANRIVHPVNDQQQKTVVNGLLAEVDKLSKTSSTNRPGIVHRLDKETSGLLIAAKNDKSHQELIKQFKNRSVEKYYIALVEGNLNYKEAKIDAPIGRDHSNRTKMAVRKDNSKKAISHFKVLKEFQNHSLVEIRIETGRTHQIRVHFSYLGNPVVGDLKYGSKNELKAGRQLLHAKKMIIHHPTSNKRISFEAELKDDFKKILKKLNC